MVALLRIYMIHVVMYRHTPSPPWHHGHSHPVDTEIARVVAGTWTASLGGRANSKRRKPQWWVPAPDVHRSKPFDIESAKHTLRPISPVPAASCSSVVDVNFLYRSEYRAVKDGSRLALHPAVRILVTSRDLLSYPLPFGMMFGPKTHRETLPGSFDKRKKLVK